MTISRLSTMAGRRRGLRAILAPMRHVALMAAGLAVVSCSTVDSIGSSVSNTLLGGSGPAPGSPGYVKGFLGAVVADEPRAALIAREVLSGGGSAADAAVALGFALSVTLPSRAGIGGGGACLAYGVDPKGPNAGAVEAILFVPGASATPGGDRPAALPSLARGLFLLHARYGTRPFEGLIVPAEQLARFGVPASRALVRDLTLVSGPLLADPNARAVFSHDGVPLGEGGQLLQPDLGATLSQLRFAGVGDLYQGSLARRVEKNSPLAGGPISLPDLRGALPSQSAAIQFDSGRDKVAFLPPPADGGLAAAAAFQMLNAKGGTLPAAAQRADAIAAQWRATGGDPFALLNTSPPAASLSNLPASTSFITVDRKGNAVACALSMNNLFGTGRIVPGLGFLLAASPNSVAPPLLAASIAWNANVHAFRAAVSGSGQQGAALAVGNGMAEAMRGDTPTLSVAPEPGRSNAIVCPGYLPGEETSCRWATDPRGAGLAVGSN